MKSDTFVLIGKLLCYVLIGGLTPLASSLAQWANDGSWPPRINWIIIVGGCVVGAATQVLSFLSSSYATYSQTRKGLANPPTG